MEYNRIIQGDTKEVLKTLPAGSVNCIVTSPPYWGLRDYKIKPQIWDGDKNCNHEWGNKIITLKHKSGETNPGKEGWYKDRGASDDKGNCFCVKCGAWKGNLGLEPTFELYIKHLCDIFDEGKRVLRDDGTCWVNLGDTYWGGGQGGTNYGGKEVVKESNYGHIAKGRIYKTKSLCLIPQRFAIEMINRGWILRNTIIWHKPNCMPSSARNRFTVDFEYLYFFTKSNKTQFWTNSKTGECVKERPSGIKGIEGKDWEWRRIGENYENSNTKINMEDAEKYNSPKARKYRKKELKKVSLWKGHDYWFEQQFEQYTKPLNRWAGDNLKANNKSNWDEATGQKTYRDRNMRPNGQGRNKRAVWTISTQPFPEAHFAVFPEVLIETPIKAGCPEYVCKKCGLARMKILKPTEEYSKYLGKNNLIEHHAGQETKTKFKVKTNAEYEFKGYTDCGCNAGFEPGVTLDPFMGSGTTGVEAKKQGKRYLGVELKKDYIEIAKRRIAKTIRKPETLF